MNLISRRLLRPLGLEARRKRALQHRDCIELKTRATSKGTALLAYVIDPFLLAKGEPPSRAHTHHVESLLMAQVLLDLGYDVDVIDYRNKFFRPKKNYRILLSARTYFEVLADRLNDDCVCVAHLDTAHFLFNNSAAFARLQALKERRSIATASLKVIESNWAPERADALTVLGNAFTLGTYAYAEKPMYALPVPTPEAYPSPADKDFETIRNRYIWLGSRGFAHKGLDLVLESFAAMPHLHLSVCGPIEDHKERHFREAYRHELYELPNIETVGWVDVGSPQFARLIRRCLGLVYPSASEGQAGAVATCLRAGLIPIVSYESGTDIGKSGHILAACTVEHICESLNRLSQQPSEMLRKMAIDAWHLGETRHSQESYKQLFREAMTAILEDAGGP
jgi:hypothetical protein